MPANVSADGLRRGPRVRVIVEPARFTPRQKLLLLLLNAVPFLHAASTLTIAAILPCSCWPRLAAATAVFFFGPPILSRCVLFKPLPRGTVPVPSAAFFQWWATWQLQGVFNRITWIEEIMRLIPGGYSLWLRLWGARIGRLTLWSPGVRIFDRSLIHIGDDVVLGLDVRIAGHFGSLDENGRSTMTIGAVRIDDGCTIGASNFLGPGFHLENGQFTEVLFLGLPFTRWRHGIRQNAEESTFPLS